MTRLRGPRLFLDGFVQRDSKRVLQALNFCRRRRSHVHSHAGRLGDRVNRSPAANHTDIEGRLRGCRYWNTSELTYGLSEHHNGIWRSEIAPGMPARSAHNYFKTAAAQSLGNDSVVSGSIQHQVVSNVVEPAAVRKDVPQPTQVAFTFFADIGNEKNRRRKFQSDLTESGRNAEQRRHSRAIVGNSRAKQSGALLTDI